MTLLEALNTATAYEKISTGLIGLLVFFAGIIAYFLKEMVSDNKARHAQHESQIDQLREMNEKLDRRLLIVETKLTNPQSKTNA